MSFKCFQCQKKVKGNPCIVTATIPLPPYTVIVDDNKDRKTVLQKEVKLCLNCSQPLRNSAVHTTSTVRKQ
jgi:hypothetical protein